MTMQAATTEPEAISEADAARSEHRSRMDALAHWLSYTKGWTPYEAACLALGVLPNDAHSRGFGQPLPGTKPWPSPMRESWEWRMRRDIKELAERLTTVSGFGFMPAAKQLVAIQQHHGRLPWWAVALADEVCAPLLPDGAEASQQPSEGQGKRSVRQVEANRQNAVIGWRKRKPRQAILTIGGPEFDRLRDLGFPDCWERGRDGKPNAETITDRIDALIQKTLESRPKEWPKYSAILKYVRHRNNEADDAKSETDDAIA